LRAALRVAGEAAARPALTLLVTQALVIAVCTSGAHVHLRPHFAIEQVDDIESRTSCPAARVSAAYAGRTLRVSSERSKRAQALPSGCGIDSAQKFAGSHEPARNDGSDKRTFGHDAAEVTSTARTAGFGIRALLLGPLVVTTARLSSLYSSHGIACTVSATREMLLALGRWRQQVGLADVLVCVLVLGIELSASL